ncbi:MAG: type II secretion system F family protein [Methanobacteriaceae archaeon]|jgi:flagellar protein FlaJ|nr:type II secretion system F family protein [Candidatus Methanorudis spinitermitis]
MNFLGSISFKLVIFCKKLFKHHNNENIKKNNYKHNNDYIDNLYNKDLLNHENDFYKDHVNNFHNETLLSFENKEDNEDSQEKNDNNYLKNIYFKIKNKLNVNNDNNQELLFKELKNQFDHDNQYNNLNNFNNTIKGKNSFYKKYSLNKILSQNIQEKINIRIFFPITLAILVISAVLSYILLGFEIALIIILIGLIGFFLIFYFPKMEKKKKYSEISRELPYALRHMVTELKSGKGLHDTLNSIAMHDYGALSEEFSRVLEEIKYGENTEVSLINMSLRVSSNGLDRVVRQIIGTLRTGGNLSNTLNIIAEDITHDLQMELKDYSQKLNAFVMIYTFLAILGPVIFLIMLMAASTVMGDIVPSNLILILYLFFFPMIVIFMGLMIKRLEPSV